MKEENKKITMDDLAMMVQKGFLGMEEKVEKVEKIISEAKNELKSDIADIKTELNKKVDIFTHKELEYRMEKLEEKVGITRTK